MQDESASSFVSLSFEDMDNLVGEEPRSEQSNGSSGTGTSDVLEDSPTECSHFSGGSEFELPLRIRHIQRQFPEDYQTLDNELQEVVGKYTRAIDRQSFDVTSRYMSDVIFVRDDDHRRRLNKWFTECGPHYPRRLFIWVDEGDHFHTVHDCPYSGSRCRCKFTQTEDFRGHVRKQLRRNRFISELDKIDWQNVFIYFVMQKRESRSQIWIGGRNQGPPSCSESLRWGNVQALARTILAREVEGTGHNNQREFQLSEENRKRVSRSNDGPGEKRSKFERITEEVQVLLDKYSCIPPSDLKDIIPPSHKDYNINFHDPRNSKIYDAACHLYMLDCNRRTLADFKNFYNDKLPIFYANSINPFDYYHDRETSVNYLNDLLLFQCGGDTDKLRELLGNIKTWFNKQGWSQLINGKYEINPKINCVVILGPPNSGKNYFWDTIAAVAMNVGHIGRVNNKTNQFALQDAHNRRLVMGNEINMEEGAKEDFKKLCEGTAFNIRVKYQGDKIFKRTPIVLISNFDLDICGDPHFRNVRLITLRWKSAPLLASSKKKPYPLALFDLYDMYDIGLE